MIALGYARVSTNGQEQRGVSLAAQRRMITEEAERRGCALELIIERGSGKSIKKRPKLLDALDRLDRHEADALIVAKLDRLSRSVIDGGKIIERAQANGWDLIVLDFALDTSTPSGRLVVNVILSAAQFEREMISSRTKDALAERKAQGVRLGRPSTLKVEILTRILLARAEGQSYQRIADQLNEDQVETAQSGRTWHAATVRKAVHGQAAALLLAHWDDEAEGIKPVE